MSIFSVSCVIRDICLKKCLGRRFIHATFGVLSEQTHFGFQSVSKDEKTQKVSAVFDSVAKSYDNMNDIMSCGIHRIWKDKFVAELTDPSSPRYSSLKLLDVAGGTGDIAFRFFRNSNLYKNDLSPVVYCCDINKSMLAVGKERAVSLNIGEDRLNFVEGDAQKLPFESDIFDAYTIAFGIRNVVNIEQALIEAYRVLKPGGRFLCLEFGHVTNPLLSYLYDIYSFNIIPPIGKVVAGDWHSYEYLVESIRQFPHQEKFCDMIYDAGFLFVNFKNLTGGIAVIYSGFKL